MKTLKIIYALIKNAYTSIKLSNHYVVERNIFNCGDFFENVGIDKKTFYYIMTVYCKYQRNYYIHFMKTNSNVSSFQDTLIQFKNDKEFDLLSYWEHKTMLSLNFIQIV